ncbi:MAG: hypothetical protein Q8N01_06015 [Sulfuricurvum sp.]|nr:hypothetical protein [Sulfuricurvum sp.]
MKSKLPLLGRPLTGGSIRSHYLKFYLSESELENFNNLEKNVIKIYENKGFHYNRPAFFRLVFENIDNLQFIDYLLNNSNTETLSWKIDASKISHKER